MTLLLDADDISGLFELPDALEAVRSGLLEQANGDVQLPPRMTIDTASGHGWLRIMPAILNRTQVMGFKAMHSTPGKGVRYLVTLIDLMSGQVLALLDADRVTQVRTAATGAIGTDLLARP